MLRNERGAPFLFSSRLVLSLVRPLRHLRDARILHIGGASRQGRRRGVRDHANTRTNARSHSVTISVPLFLSLSFSLFLQEEDENRKSPEKDGQREREARDIRWYQAYRRQDRILARAARAPVKSTVQLLLSALTQRGPLLLVRKRRACGESWSQLRSFFFAFSSPLLLFLLLLFIPLPFFSPLALFPSVPSLPCTFSPPTIVDDHKANELSKNKLQSR